MVKRALLGTWPGTIVQWGADAIDAYLYILQARGLTAEEVLRAIGTWPAGSNFPPSAPNLAAQARRDPGAPTFEEAVQLIQHVLAARTTVRKARWEMGERERLDRRAQLDRSHCVHPLVGAFVASYGFDQLDRLDLDDEEYGQARRKQLRDAWEKFGEAVEGRDVAALASGRRGEGLGQLDPLQAIERGAEQERAELEAGR